MIGYHPAFDAAYRTAVLLAAPSGGSRADRFAALLGEGSSQLISAASPEMTLSDSDRQRIHAALELQTELRLEVLATLTRELAGAACWLWLNRNADSWQALTLEILELHDELRLCGKERNRLEAGLEERTEQWRTVMRQLSTASAELERKGSSLLSEAPAEPLSAGDWDEILGQS